MVTYYLMMEEQYDSLDATGTIRGKIWRVHILIDANFNRC